MATSQDRPADKAGERAADRSAVFAPLYRQIKQLIVTSLEQGEWKPGELIPSEMELAARFQVSQGTVRKAVDELAAENLLVRRQGKGTFVATHHEPRAQYRFLRLQPDAGTGARPTAGSWNAVASAPRPRSPRCWNFGPRPGGVRSPAAELRRRADRAR